MITADCKHPLYPTWRAMIYRCKSPNCECFKSYGGRGIVVCDRWLKFKNFLADMGDRPEGLSLDRIDNNGNYEPGNCRWTTGLVQARNKRPANKGQAKDLSECAKKIVAYLIRATEAEKKAWQEVAKNDSRTLSSWIKYQLNKIVNKEQKK